MSSENQNQERTTANLWYTTYGRGPALNNTPSHWHSIPSGFIYTPDLNRWDADVGIDDDEEQVSMVNAAAADLEENPTKKIHVLLNALESSPQDLKVFKSTCLWLLTVINEASDKCTLKTVIERLFERATGSEGANAEVYARLCRALMGGISPDVKAANIVDKDGKAVAGGHLFRKLLLNACQEGFEGGFVKEAEVRLDALKDDERARGDGKDEGYYPSLTATTTDGTAVVDDQKRRQRVGLARFMGELFKQHMLTERILHECVKKLIGSVGDGTTNDDEELALLLEMLDALLRTIGQILDTPKARAHMDVYFSRIKEASKNARLSTAMRLRLQDLISLREHKWVCEPPKDGPQLGPSVPVMAPPIQPFNPHNVSQYLRQADDVLHVGRGPSQTRWQAPAPASSSNVKPNQRAHKELYDVGLAMKRKVVGDSYADNQLKTEVSEFMRPMHELALETGWGTIWPRPGLELKVRSLIIIALSAAQGRDSELAGHIVGAVNIGASEIEIREALLHTATFCGMPTGMHAFRVGDRVIKRLKEERKLP